MRKLGLVLLTVACSSASPGKGNETGGGTSLGGATGAGGSDQSTAGMGSGGIVAAGGAANGGTSAGGAGNGGSARGGSGGVMNSMARGGASSGGSTSGGATGSGGKQAGGAMGKGGSKAMGAGGSPPTGTRVLSVSGNAAPVAGTWRNITPSTIDPGTYACSDVQFDPSSPSTLYALFGDGGGLWKSTDGGIGWVEIGHLPKPNSLGRILVDPQDPGHLYMTGSVTEGTLGFWVSHDGGNSWAVPAAFAAGASSTWNNDVYNVVADPTDFNHFLLTFHNGWPAFGDAAGILESKDGGDSFITHNPASGMDHGQGIAFLYDPANSTGNANTWLVGAGYNAGLFRTSDAGKTWTQVSTLQENHGGFDAHYSAQGYLYIGGSDGVYRSTDNGATWVSQTKGVDSGYYYSVIGDGKRLYTAQSFVGVEFNQPFLTAPEGGGMTEGTSWTKFSSQTFAQGPWKMAFDKTNKIIYGSFWGSGVWALTVNP